MSSRSRTREAPTAAALTSFSTATGSPVRRDRRAASGNRSPPWLVQRLDELADERGALIAITGDGEPELLADLDGARVARAWPVGSRPERRDAGESPAAALFRAAADGNRAARRVRAKIADHLAAAVQLLVLTVDVDVVVLGGGVSEVGEQLRLAVADGLSQRGRTSPFLASLDLPARITLAPTGLPIAALGAALLAPGREPV